MAKPEPLVRVVGLFSCALLCLSTSMRAADEEYKPVRREIPAKCSCGCGRDFLDCNHDCSSLDTLSSKEREEIKDAISVRIEVPRELFPRGEWIYGAKITVVFKDTPAKNGSTKPGGKGNQVKLEVKDIITHINGQPIKSERDYYELMHGNNEKRVTVIDWDTKIVYHDYFRPKGGRIGIKFQPIRLKLDVKEKE